MPIGSFPKVGKGTAEDPFRPDISSMKTENTRGRFRKRLKENPDGTIECEYDVVVINQAEKDRARLDEIRPKLENGTATQAEQNECCALLCRVVCKGS